jgi:hypothetical protein
MKTCFLYSLLAPVEEDFADNRSIPPLVVLPVKLKDGREWEAAILGTPSKICATRISIPETEGSTIDPEDYKRYLKLRIYLLDCIRVNYDSSIEYFRKGDSIFSFHNFVEPDVGPNMALKIREPLNPDYRVKRMDQIIACRSSFDFCRSIKFSKCISR